MEANGRDNERDSTEWKWEDDLNKGGVECVELREKSKDLEEGRQQEIHFQGTEEGEAIEKGEVTGHANKKVTKKKIGKERFSFA